GGYALVAATPGLISGGSAAFDINFESNWTTVLGPSDAAVRDGGRWDQYSDFSNGEVLSVVAGGPQGYANALRVQQRGESSAAYIQKSSFFAPSTDYYVRFYMRNDDTSNALDHVVSAVFTAPHGRIFYVMKTAGASDWGVHMALYYLSGHCGDDFT